MATVYLDTNNLADYRKFLKIKSLPKYSITGHVAEFPDEYASEIGVEVAALVHKPYEPESFLYDYQRDIARIAIEKQKYAIFMQCGLGKTLVIAEFARHARECSAGRRVLIVSPLMVVPQTIAEVERFYGVDYGIEQVSAANLNDWLATPGYAIGITNYEAIREGIRPGLLGALILDESSMLKSMDGTWATRLIDLGKGLAWKLCATGTPAPNDRIEFANHAVFLDHFSTTNAFLAKFFINRGQTGERWEIKGHALKAFYHALSHWCIFVENPATYGWKENTDTIPPIEITIHSVDTTEEQRQLVQDMTGSLFANNIGGITGRSRLSQVAKGWVKVDGNLVDVPTNKYHAIRELVRSWPDESTIIWCWFNEEQDRLEREFPDAASISGATPHSKRQAMIDSFKAGQTKMLISKPDVLGFGLNLQVATRQVFSSLIDSYEAFHQAVKRSNRIGSTRPLHVHIPITDIEEPMVATVLKKMHRVDADTREQERLFRENSYAKRYRRARSTKGNVT